MEKMKGKQIAGMFFTVFAAAFFASLALAVGFTIALGYDALLLKELGKCFVFGGVIAFLQLVWIGSDVNNKTYMIRTVIHFVLLLTSCTLLMMWFGWLPPSAYLVSYYFLFIVIYIVIWLVFLRINKKKWKEMNEKLDAYKKANKE